jgi:flagellar biosynthesis protein FlhG
MNYQEGEFLYEKLNMVVKQFLGMELEFLGIIPQDNSVSKAVMKQKPVTLMYPRSEAAQCIRTIAENLDSSQDPVFIRKNGMRAFLRNVFSRNY